MLKLQPKATFWAPVMISIPGSPKPVKVDFEFNFKGRKEMGELIERINSEGLSDFDLMREIVNGWKGVDQEFSYDNLDQLVDQYPTAAPAIWKTFNEEVFEAKGKN